PNPPMAWLICGSAFGGSLRTDVAIGWAKTDPLRGEVAFTALDLSPYLPHGEGQPRGRASITGVVRFLDGGMSGSPGLTASIAFDEVRAPFGDVEFANVGQVRIDVEQGRVLVRRARLGGAGTRLELRGSGSQDELAFRLDGDVDV